MSGKKLGILEKGKKSGVTLDQSVDITSATYSDTTDNMVNMVRIYSDKREELGKVQSKKQVKKYGIYQQTYTKEEKVDAKSAAKALLVGITKEASIEAIGNLKAISGYSINIQDKVTGLTGTFYITEDTHTFENGVHTMTLGLSWSNIMEEGAQTEKEDD